MAPSEKNPEIDLISAYLRYHQQTPLDESRTEVVVSPGSADIDILAKKRALLRRYQVPPYYAQLPDGLLTSKKVSPDAKVIYALLHKHAPIKDLNRMPVVKVSQRTLADEMGRSEETVRELIIKLVAEGWIGKCRQGRMKLNKYVLYPRSKRTFEAYIAIERVQLRIQRDQALAKRLRESLYPQSDHTNLCGQSPHQNGGLTTRARGAY